MADKRFKDQFNSWHPVVQRAWRASGGVAYNEGAGSQHANAQRASDEAWARERSDRKINQIMFQRDTGRPAPPDYGSPYGNAQSGGYTRSAQLFTDRPVSLNYRGPQERTPGEQAQESARIADFQRQGGNQRFSQPMEAGKIGDRGVRVVGPHMIEYALPSGGTTTFTTTQNGKLVDAHSYLVNKPGFVPNPEYFKARGAAQETAAGLPPVDTSKVVPGAGGDYLSRGGVMAPVENLGAADRTKYDTGSPLQRVADAFTTSPAAVAAKTGFGKAVAALGNIWNNATGADTAAGVSRAQAARIQTPTAASPIPKTETSPAADVNTTKLTTSPTPAPPVAAQSPTPTPLPEDWQNRRFAYEGF